MSILSMIGIKSSQEIAAQSAAALVASKAAADLAAQNLAHDAGVTALIKDITVTPDSPVEKIIDSYTRAPQAVFANGSNPGYGLQRQAATALATKEALVERRWEFMPTEEYTKAAGSFDMEKLQTLFRTQQETSGDFSETITRSLVAPVSPSAAVDGLPYKPVVLYDTVAKARVAIGNWDELFTAAKSLLGVK